VTDRGGENLELQVADLSVPLQSDGSMYIYYAPTEQSRFVSAEDVLTGKAPAEMLNQKLVLIGVTGLGLLDYQVSTLGERIPGVEIHAQLLEQMFDHSFLRRPTGGPWI